MINYEEFCKNSKFNALSNKCVDDLKKLMGWLAQEGYSYRGKWRADREEGGHIFVFEVLEKRGVRKNLITLRPQKDSLKIEVYWSKYDKKYFDVYDHENGIEDLMKDINKLASQYNLK